MYEKLRKHPRVSLQTELWIGQDGIFTRTDEFLRDLSVGGAFVQSRQVYSVGDIVNLRFKMPESASLATCSAIVRNMLHGDGFGVQFLDLSGDNLRLVERHIDSTLSSSF
ncbi:MAG: PilZ domain-containing protein [Pyrinomonadaceae bacterium]|nr:PilZ domain-containing protein [Pyrinomonadaceae bacterium]